MRLNGKDFEKVKERFIYMESTVSGGSEKEREVNHRSSKEVRGQEWWVIWVARLEEEVCSLLPNWISVEFWVKNVKKSKRMEVFDVKWLRKALGVHVMDLIMNRDKEKDVGIRGVCWTEWIKVHWIGWGIERTNERKIHPKNVWSGSSWWQREG